MLHLLLLSTGKGRVRFLSDDDQGVAKPLAGLAGRRKVNGVATTRPPQRKQARDSENGWNWLLTSQLAEARILSCSK